MMPLEAASACLCLNLNQLRVNNAFCDFHLISCSGDAIPVHRCVLSACSTHLHELIVQNSHTLHLKYSTQSISELILAIYSQCSKHSDLSVNFVNEDCKTLAKELQVEHFLGIYGTDLCGFETSIPQRMTDDGGTGCLITAQLQPPNNDHTADSAESRWKLCKYCSQFKGKKKGFLDFHVKKCEKAVVCCLLCHEPFMSDTEVKSHDCKRKRREAECEDCGKVIVSRDGMRRHKMSHSSKKQECEMCGKRFSRPNHLQLHIKRIHGTSRPFVCVICARTFALQFDLNDHMRVMHDPKRSDVKVASEEEIFACPDCNMIMTAHSIHEHQVLHEAERNSKLPKLLPKFPVVTSNEDPEIEPLPPSDLPPPLTSSFTSSDLLLNEDIVLRESMQEMTSSPVHCDLLEESHAASNLLVNQFLDNSSIAANLAHDMADPDDLSFSLASLPLSHTFGSFDGVSMESPFNDKFYPSINKDDF